ncbi:hypothetical protein SAMN04488505_102584 [Chitinophaga rupis]|uniref:Uncharacterized protein n=1 Tax=Chitinophaga rupis TaxID=573321 RepID=A0A1H7RDB7_9BACT|nr:hypothetical protein SAMN04488505_102584 [Chitinophaga rupis]
MLPDLRLFKDNKMIMMYVDETVMELADTYLKK